MISYLFQMFIMVYALKKHILTPGETPWWWGSLVALLLSVMTIWLFNWARKNPPDYESAYFGIFDKKDFSAVVLLIIGLFSAFASARFAASGILTMVLSDPANAFYCTQSILLNFGIVALLIIGLRLHNKELLVVAGIIVVIAATKVFLFDLINTNGMPLVLSVFSFGVVAATSSVVMKKWSGKVRELSDGGDEMSNTSPEEQHS